MLKVHALYRRPVLKNVQLVQELMDQRPDALDKGGRPPVQTLALLP
jgi:hypothetical protein